MLALFGTAAAAGALASLPVHVTLRRRFVSAAAFVLAAAFTALAIATTPVSSTWAALVIGAIVSAAVAWGLDDAFRGYIADWISYPAILITAVFGSFAAGVLPTLIGGAVCGGYFLAYRFVDSLVRRVRGQVVDPLGLGDVKVGVAIGCALGAHLGFFAILVGAMLASAVIVFARVRGLLEPGDRIRLGPYLAYGVIIVTLGRPHIPL